MLKRWVRSQLAARGYEVVRQPDDLEADFAPMRAAAARYTGAPVDKLYSLYEAIRYLQNNAIAGDFVECGVAAGGCSVLAAMAMQHFGTKRRMWLYDTFEGMPEPGVHDKSNQGVIAHEVWKTRQDRGGWQRFTLDTVKAAMATTNYDPSLIEYVQGMVEATIPARAPAAIAMLRLDTDFYESTLHELRELYPRLAIGGVLYIDDYYAWTGARRAVDEYFTGDRPRPMLTRLTSGSRIGIKVATAGG